MKRRAMNFSRGAFVFTALFCIVFYLAPLLYLLVVALQSSHQFLVNPLTFPHPIVWQNFIHAWRDATMGVYFSNSVVYTGAATIISVGLAIFLAFPVERRYVRGWNWVYLSMVLGFFLPIGIIPLFIESQLLHLYNNRVGYILLHVQGGLTLGFIFFVAYFRTIPRELDESAALDGCGYTRYVFQIVLPLIKPALATVSIYAAVAVWNDLIGPVVFLANNSLFPLTRGLFAFYGSYQSEWTLLAAGIFIVASPLIVAFILLQRSFIEGSLSGSLKL